ncbi:MAG: type II toxin-antitoxin system MqsA family antitoxin [Deltaproteobacteria bacterium]|nr:type II toxin-antitoxin system MqsA family antitoxin [Deltaproteobacteria bacterium]
MKCSECGATMKVTHRDHRYTECGLPNVILAGLEFRTCQKCGEEERVMPRLTALHRMIAEAVAEKPARLTGAEVRFLRKHLGWSGEDFANVMGVRQETVSRWETEKERMGVVSERLLRLMALRLRPVEEYPNERLAEVGKEDPRPVSLRLRPNSSGWRMEEAA